MAVQAEALALIHLVQTMALQLRLVLEDTRVMVTAVEQLPRVVGLAVEEVELDP